jgi:hypothetical protein
MLATSIDRYACSAAGRSFCSERSSNARKFGMTRIRRQKTLSVPGSRNGFRFVDLTT